MLDCSIVWDGPRCTWTDQDAEKYFILVDEAAGEVGEPILMTSADADDLNILRRLTDSPWRWFRFEEKEKAN